MVIADQTLLLLSEGYRSLPRLGHLFEKPPSETKLVCITTAMTPYDEAGWWLKERQALEHLGFSILEFDIAGKQSSEIENALHDTGVIYVTGGNTFFLLEKINQSGFADIVKKRLAAGALYVGSSAGSIVAGNEIGFIAGMDDPSAAALTDFKAMGLVDFAILPHLDHAEFGEIAGDIHAKADPALKMIGLRDDQAILVRGSHVEIL